MKRNNNILYLGIIVIYTLASAYSTCMANSVQDYRSIQDCISKNINYYREHPEEYDEMNFYEPFSEDEKIQIRVDTLIYKPDSLFAVAFVGIQNLIKNNHHALAFMCYREKKENNFNIYPLFTYKAIDFESYEKAIYVIKDCFMNQIRSQQDMYRLKFKSAVGDTDFWSESLYFQKFNGLYYFQQYYKFEDSGRKLTKQIYPFCNNN